MKIALDVDGVLADLAGMIIKIYREATGVHISRDMITEWEFWVKLNLTRNQFVKLIVMAWERWSEMEPLENDLAEDSENLMKVGEVDILTQRPAETINFVKKWLKLHGVNYRRFVWVPLHASKASFYYDVYIDDSPRLAEKLANKRSVLLLYDQNWNKKVPHASNIVRISSLDDAFNRLVNGSIVV
ncbi:MAG: hypothetical protein RMI49_01190 [Candidatus Caldarchaeum sp.]|nr:hypothetical protein [Candidatus Caldarchaeum sp.]